MARLFIYLEASFFRSEPPSRIAAGSQDDKVKILGIQKQLEQDVSFQGISETQHVDLNVTRHWIRTIIWQYTITHFAFSCHSKVPAFSATYPAQIAKDSLALLSTASSSAICAHGYGMVSRHTFERDHRLLTLPLQELKILRLANSVLDVLVCLPALKYSAAASGWRDALHSLEQVLQTVGGGSSHFAALLKRRMMETDLPVAIPGELPLPRPELSEEEKPYALERFLEAPESYGMDDMCRIEEVGSYAPSVCT